MTRKQARFQLHTLQFHNPAIRIDTVRQSRGRDMDKGEAI